MTLHILRYHDSLILLKPRFPRNEALEHEWIVVWSATRNKRSCLYGVTIQNGEIETITDPMMIDILFVLDLTIVMDQVKRRSGNRDITNQRNHPECRTKMEIWMKVHAFSSRIYVDHRVFLYNLENIPVTRKAKHESADVGVPLRAVKTLLTNIHVSLVNWNYTTTIKPCWLFFSY